MLEKLQQALKEKTIDKFTHDQLKDVYKNYTDSLKANHITISDYESLLETLLELVKNQLANPFQFSLFHQQITTPFDYHQFGIDFVRPLINKQESEVWHKENLHSILKQIENKENVILFANHQTEIDPQLINFALEADFPKLAADIIFIAGDRVISDPLAVPFSMGRNLLCIYSKRHINNPPEQKEAKLHHNRRTMQQMRELLSEGGKCIFVAPSGGRDRVDSFGNIHVAPFDPHSIAMFYLITKRANKTTHFYPLTLSTYNILPPPDNIESKLGEKRPIQRSSIFFSFGKELDHPKDMPFPHETKQGRELVASHIWEIINTEYAKIEAHKQKQPSS